ncbi:hypothetical protein EYF80_048000 [Liparis tanakae]|uniref:Uncharacterized protein n=1 Tax=Liparis tanakae TaxID=230148 RepID=A0A4Z2FNC2_9TELE|nr:hypothetical protein EYF80_048000 [Liparis tanakae]
MKRTDDEELVVGIFHHADLHGPSGGGREEEGAESEEEWVESEEEGPESEEEWAESEEEFLNI